MTDPQPDPAVPGMPEVGDLMPGDSLMATACGVSAASVMSEAGVTDCLVLTVAGRVAADTEAQAVVTIVLPPGGALQLADAITGAVEKLPGGAR